MSRKLRTPKVCPVCGEDVPPKALSCPECGSCHKTGWKDDADIYDGVDLPDDEFDYDDFVSREFGNNGRDIKPVGMSPLWWFTAIVLFIILLVGLLRSAG